MIARLMQAEQNHYWTARGFRLLSTIRTAEVHFNVSFAYLLLHQATFLAAFPFQEILNYYVATVRWHNVLYTCPHLSQ
jgi:hypothetical protein